MINKHRKPMSTEGNGHRRLRLAAAFMAGMAVTAILAQTPLADRLLSSGTAREPSAPSYIQGGDRSDTIKPPALPIGELVCAPDNDSVPSGRNGYPARPEATPPA